MSIMSIQSDDRCEQCGKIYEGIFGWCKPCQINHLENNFPTSKNKKIDDFIQRKQQNINCYNDVVFEWIPHNQFNNIKKMNKNNVSIAVWKDGPVYYYKKWIRKSDKVVMLKYIPQNDIDEFLNK